MINTATPTMRRTLGERIDRIDELMDEKDELFYEIFDLVNKVRNRGGIDALQGIIWRCEQGPLTDYQPVGPLIARIEQLTMKREALEDEIQGVLLEAGGSGDYSGRRDVEVMRAAIARHSDKSTDPIAMISGPGSG